MTTPSIFISYRIADTLTQAGRLHQSLENYFGKGAVFYDKNSLKPGMKWPKELEGKVQGASVVLALIADKSKWLGVNEEGIRRTDDPEDWVRREVETALTTGKLLIPVFFRNATLPSKNALPESLHALLECQGHEIRESHWDDDLNSIFQAIGNVIGSKRTEEEKKVNDSAYDPLEGLPLPPPPAYSPPVQPYKGLTWFTEEDARVFFGREEEIAELYKAKLEDPFIRTVLFYGSSGAGKSSLLHAGLLPRLRQQGWQPVYRRRTLDGSTEEIIEKYLADLKKEKPPRPLLILDQLEEIYTNPAGAGEVELLPDRIRMLLEASEQVRLLLGFREEYLARISNLMKKGGVPYLEQHLRTISEQGARRAILAIPSSGLKIYYGNLAFAEGEGNLPERIARDIFSQHEQDVAPLLQFILRSMWDEVSKTNNAVFSRALYKKHRRSSILELLDKQLDELSKDFPEEVENGLVLDLLQHLVTSESTADAQEEQILLNRYRHVQEKIILLCQTLKGLHLLDEFVDERNQKFWRLAHDALAPAIERRFLESTALGQRARALLANIDRNYDVDTLITKFSTPPISLPDLEIIQNGQKGIQVLRDNQRFLIQLCESYYEAELKRIESISRVNEYCKEAKEFINQLQYDSAYHSISQTIIYKVKQHEIACILQEVAFVLAEIGQQRMTLKCLRHLQEIVPHSWLPEALTQLSTLVGEQFRDKTHSIIKLLNKKLFAILNCRYFPEMVEVQGGTFKFNAGIRKNNDHQIILNRYQIARTPVTWWQYALYCRATGQEMPRSPAWGRLGNHPAVYISWYDAVQYLNWVSKRLGHKPRYKIDCEKKDLNNKFLYDELRWTITSYDTDKGLRLPTQIEWEYAARGGLFSHETIFAGSNDADEVAWHYGNSENHTHPVGEKQANELGLYDMCGNVWEWCWDWYEKDYSEKNSILNPLGPLSGSYRVYRGGSWYVNVDCCRIDFRNYYAPNFQRNDLGFRPARTL